jgi:hypothetical protein
MYIIVHDTLPDKAVLTYDEMYRELLDFPSCVAYEYDTRMNGTMVIGRRYRLINNEIGISLAGKWACPAAYYEYKFPNICSMCKHACYMKGSECTFCEFCLDCGKEDCKCHLTDY